MLRKSGPLGVVKEEGNAPARKGSETEQVQ